MIGGGIYLQAIMEWEESYQPHWDLGKDDRKMWNLWNHIYFNVRKSLGIKYSHLLLGLRIYDKI